MADVLSPAFVDHYAMNYRERSHQQTYMNHSKTSEGSSPDVKEVTDSFFSGSLDCSSSKEDGTKPEQIHERAVNGLKQPAVVPVTSMHIQIKLHSKSVQAPKMQPDRFRKDIKEEDVSAASSDTLAARDLTTLRSGGVECSEMFGVSSRSILQSVPSEVLELICKGLSPFDLCSLCQVNGYFQKVCSEEGYWSPRRVGNFDKNLSSKENVLSAESKKVYVQPLVEPVRLKGDYVIGDPFRILGWSVESPHVELEHELHDLQQQNQWVFVVRYRNQIIAYFISADNYDPEPAFEISRDGTTLGVHEHPSRFIGVFKKEVVDLLLKESGEDKGTTPDGGVTVQGVDGELICSGDGDFVISGSPHSRKVSRWIEDDCVRNADILCAAGGRWTFCDDSSDEDEGDGEITDEDMEIEMTDEDMKMYREMADGEKKMCV